MKALAVPAVLFGIFAYCAYSAPHTVAKSYLGLQRDTAPGYHWSQPDSMFSYETAWAPGETRNAPPHLTAGDQQDSWQPDAGYSLTQNGNSPVGFLADWSPGSSNPAHPHIHAASGEGKWDADSGYQLAFAGSLDAIPIPVAPPQQSASSGPSGGTLLVAGAAALGCALWKTCRDVAADVGKKVVADKIAESMH